MKLSLPSLGAARRSSNSRRGRSPLATLLSIAVVAGAGILGANAVVRHQTPSAPATLGYFTPGQIAPGGAAQGLQEAGMLLPAADLYRVNPDAVRGALQSLAIAAPASTTAYSRANFGAPWADVDRNGCDTRNDILRRDLASPTFKPGTRNCKVLAGTLHDAYSGQTLSFQACTTKRCEVQIDHMFPLKNAWEHGAYLWTPQERLAFANDPENLTAVESSENTAKSDSGPGSWLPSEAARCPYVARFVFIATKYKLSITATDRDAITASLASCPTGAQR